MREKKKAQLVNRKSERVNIGIEEADNGGRSERDKMESLEVARQTLEWSGVEEWSYVWV